MEKECKDVNKAILSPRVKFSGSWLELGSIPNDSVELLPTRPICRLPHVTVQLQLPWDLVCQCPDHQSYNTVVRMIDCHISLTV